MLTLPYTCSMCFFLRPREAFSLMRCACMLILWGSLHSLSFQEKNTCLKPEAFYLPTVFLCNNKCFFCVCHICFVHFTSGCERPHTGGNGVCMCQLHGCNGIWSNRIQNWLFCYITCCQVAGHAMFDTLWLGLCLLIALCVVHHRKSELIVTHLRKWLQWLCELMRGGVCRQQVRGWEICARFGATSVKTEVDMKCPRRFNQPYADQCKVNFFKSWRQNVLTSTLVETWVNFTEKQ